MSGIDLQSIGGVIVKDLTGLISGGGGTSVLKDILGDVLGQDGAATAKEEALSYLEKRLDAQEGRTGGKALSHAALKQMENAMSPDHAGHRPAGMTADQQIALGLALARNHALAKAASAEAFLQLAYAQAALELARGTAGEDAARKVREQAEDVYTICSINEGRVVAGAAAQTVIPVNVPNPLAPAPTPAPANGTAASTGAPQ